MSTLETDDEIAASGCIESELARKFASACAATLHYKKALCRLAVSRHQWRAGIDNCLADPDFKGSTVRNGGVGGR